MNYKTVGLLIVLVIIIVAIILYIYRDRTIHNIIEDDVVFLADLILNGSYLEEGDLNNDQTVSVLDIIALIDLILFED